MKKVLGFFVIVVTSIFSLSLQAMEDSHHSKTPDLILPVRHSLSEVGSEVEGLLGNPEPSSDCHWDTLPEEIKLHILSFLPAKVDKIKDFFDYSLVSSDFESLINACPFSEIKKYEFPGEEKLTINDIFFKAAQEGHYKVVETLIERGVDVNEKDTSNFEYSALIWAAKNGHTNTVQLLLDLGADIEAHDVFGNTVLMQAADNGHIDTLKLLIAHGATIESHSNACLTAFTAAWKGHTEVVKLLIDSSANIEVQTVLVTTALMLAARNGRIKTVQELLNNRAEIEVCDEAGNTALIIAAFHGHVEIVNILLDAGANIHAQNNKGHTALTSAAMNPRNCARLTVELLKDRLSKN